MSNTFVAQLDGADFMFPKNVNMKDGLFKQYERVIVRSIITSFGLDYLVSDRNGGDVDTTGKNTAKIAAYIQNQLKEDKYGDQLTMFGKM